MAVIDGKTSENYALLFESNAIHHKNHTKTSLNNALIVNYNETTAEMMTNCNDWNFGVRLKNRNDYNQIEMVGSPGYPSK